MAGFAFPACRRGDVEAATRALSQSPGWQSLRRARGLHIVALAILDGIDGSPLLVIEVQGDGERRHLAAAVADRLAVGLSSLRSALEGLPPDAPVVRAGGLAQWLMANRLRTVTRLQGHRGRSVARIRAEAALALRSRRILEREAPPPPWPGERPAQALHRVLRAKLRPAPASPRVRLYGATDEALDLLTVGTAIGIGVAVALAVLLAAAQLAIALADLLAVRGLEGLARILPCGAGWWALVALVILGLGARVAWSLLRWHERRLEDQPPSGLEPAREQQLLSGEIDPDGLVRQNHFAHAVALRSGMCARICMEGSHVILAAYNRTLGQLGWLDNMRTVHFGAWYADRGTRRLVFLSTYDGSLDSYIDDFVEKGYEGVNLAWNACTGFPRTHGIIEAGAKDGRRFRTYVRHFQAETLARWSAYPRVSVNAVWRSGRVAAGLGRARLDARAAAIWARDL